MPSAVERLKREAADVARINHPNIGQIFDIQNQDGLVFLILELVKGDSLYERLRMPSQLRIDELYSLASQLVEALAAAHGEGVIHRDLKPANLMWSAEGRLKVLDFGIAGAVGSVAASSVPGTPGYIAPELLRGKPLDERADIFGIGCVLYECACGVACFKGDGSKARLERTLAGAPDFSIWPRRLDPLRELVASMLSADPTRRPRLDEIARRLNAASSGQAARRQIPLALATPKSGFIGRDEEMKRVSRALDESRLVTLVGPAGCGKTRLLIEVLGRYQHATTEAVFVVDASPLKDATQLARDLVSTFESGAEQFGGLEGAVPADPILVAIDNCEHVLQGAADVVTRILGASSSARVVTTSREPIGLPGERVIRVSPLAVPRVEDVDDLAELGQIDSVQLLLTRAAERDTAIELTTENAPAIARICSRLDGIPLAIELAAARLAVRSPQEIADLLGQRFKLLRAPGESRPRRHQTLRAAIEWSYNLLGAEEQTLLLQLGIFPCSFTLNGSLGTVEMPDPTDEFELLDLITRLVHKSLLITTTSPTHWVCFRSEEFEMMQFPRGVKPEPAGEAVDEAYLKQIHPSLRSVLNDFGGDAVFVSAVFKSDEPSVWAYDGLDLISMFYGASDQTSFGLAWARRTFGQFLPERMIPFADANGGNQICIDAEDGTIWFWNHEHDEEETGLSRVAPSLEEFVGRLEPSPEE